MSVGHEQSDAAFYFDLGNPLAYLVAERILPTLANVESLPTVAEWQPVLERELAGRTHPPGGTNGRGGSRDERAFRESVAKRAAELGLQPLRWPARFPFDSELAMRAATYAKGIGRVVPFVQAAFRQAFAGGHDLEQIDFVLIAAAACEMHPAAVIQGAELRSVREQLAATTALARAAGVTELPALRIGERVFCGEDALEQASR